jgi:hypothetical protein
VVLAVLARLLRISEFNDVVALVTRRLPGRRGAGRAADDLRWAGTIVQSSTTVTAPRRRDVTSSMIPGALLGGRYRLDDLLDDIDGARFWRATDTVLARSVAVHALDESDPRVDAMLEGARVSATVTDPHLLRVLDADLATAWPG